MINLPFKMNFIFDFSETSGLREKIFTNFLAEIMEINPMPSVKIYLKDIDLIPKVKMLFEGLTPEINVVYSDNLIVSNSYLTEDEIVNYCTNKKQNRPFLSCAAPWLSPIINAQGDLYCCKHNKVGNIASQSFWDLWNNAQANRLRLKILEEKQLCTCNSCELFYQDAFLVVEDSKLIYKNKTYHFASEINYIKSAPKIIVIKEQKLSEQEYEVNIEPIFSDEELAEYSNKNDILFILS